MALLDILRFGPKDGGKPHDPVPTGPFERGLQILNNLPEAQVAFEWLWDQPELTRQDLLARNRQPALDALDAAMRYQYRLARDEEESGVKATPQAIAHGEALEAKARKRLADYDAGTKEISAALADEERVKAAVKDYLLSLAPGSLGRAKDQPVGRDPLADLEKWQAVAVAEAANIKSAKKAKDTLANNIAKAHRQVDKQADEEGMPDVTLDGDVRWPKVSVDAKPLDYKLPYAPNAIPLLLRTNPAARQQVKDHITLTLQKKYESVELALSPEEKVAAIARAEQVILEANRKEVACVRALRAKGHKARLRGDLDPRAVLQIEGPPPKRR